MTRRHSHHRNGVRSRLIAWGLAGIVVAPAILFGAVLPAPQAVVLAGIALLFTGAAATRAMPRRPVPALTFCFLAGAAMSAFQALPLPREFVLSVSGPSVQTAAQSFDVAGIRPAAWFLSLDPPGTWIAAVRGLSYAAVFLLAWGVSARGQGRIVLHALAFLGLAELAIGVFHALTAPEGLSVIYPGPLTARTGFHTTLLNDNHAGGLYNLCAAVFLAIALDRRGARERVFFAAGAIAMALASFATLSRGAAASLTAMTMVLGGGYLIRRRVRHVRALAWVALGFVVVANATVWFFLYESALQNYGHTSLSPESFAGKTQIWSLARALIADHPWFGVGPGAFVTASSPYAPIPGFVVDYAENELLQALADWGIPFGLAFAAAITFLVARRLWRCRDWPVGLTVGAGIAAVGLQSLADFGLEVPGLAIPVTAALGYLFGHPSGSRESEELPAPASRTRFLVLSGILVVATLFGLFGLQETRLYAHQRLSEAVVSEDQASDSSGFAVEEALHREVRWHPLDFQLFYFAALGHRAQGRDDRALALVEHALRLAPDSYEPLRLAAVLNARLERSAEAVNAICERLGVRLSAVLNVPSGRPGEAEDAIRRLLRVYPKRTRETFQLLRALQWSGARIRDLFEHDRASLDAYLDFLGRQRDLAAAEALLQAVLERNPDDPRALARLGWLYQSSQRREAATDIAWRLLIAHPKREAGYLLLGRLLAQQGRMFEALAMFQEAAARAADPFEAQLQILGCLADLRDFQAFDALAPEVERRVAGDRKRASMFARTLAMAQYRRGRVREALATLDRAALRDPLNAEVLLTKARILRAEHRDREALRVYQRVLMLRPGSEHLRNEIRSLGVPERAPPRTEQTGSPKSSNEP